MEEKIKIAVLGGGGRTGKYLVEQLLNDGFRVKLLLRSSGPQDLAQNPQIEIIYGDVLDLESVRDVIDGCQAVISTIGQRKGEPLVASQASTHVIRIMHENQEGVENGLVSQSLAARRYLLVAGINVDTPFDKKGPDTRNATEWMKSNFREIHEDRQKAYSILLHSDVDWTLVRVPFIEFSAEMRGVAVDPEDCRGQTITAADIAGFLISQLADESYSRTAPFIWNA